MACLFTGSQRFREVTPEGLCRGMVALTSMRGTASGRFVSSHAYSRECMKNLVLVLTVSVAGLATQQHPPISADEVTLRHRIFGDGRVTIFLLDIPPAQATVLHRHDRDMLSVFVNGGRTRASFNGAAPVEDSFTPGDVRFRSAGFTHSTENIGSERFLAVIFEFVAPQGPRASAIRPSTHICNAGSETACVDEKPLFCTSKFCVDDLTMGPHAIRPGDDARKDQILVAVSDYAFSEEAPGHAATVHTSKSGAIEALAESAARRWTNAGDPAHLVVVTVR
jgi:uncharacterized RmlC-like cupin family protein